MTDLQAPRKHFATAEVTGTVTAVRSDPQRNVVRVDVDCGGGLTVTVSVWRNPAAAAIPPGATIRAWGRLSQWGQQETPRTGIDITGSPNHGYALLAEPVEPRAGWAIRGTLEGSHGDSIAVTTVLPAAVRDGVEYPERRNTYRVQIHQDAAIVLRDFTGEDIELRGTFTSTAQSDGYGRVLRALRPVVTRVVSPDIDVAPVNGPSVVAPPAPQPSAQPPAPPTGHATARPPRNMPF